MRLALLPIKWIGHSDANKEFAQSVYARVLLV